MQYPDARRILIIKLRAIGDVILTTPVIDNLRAAYPEAEINLLTERPCYPIVKNHPHLNEVISLNRTYLQALPWYQVLGENWAFLRMLRSKRYDIVFDLFGNPRSALLAFATRAAVRVGYSFRGRRYAYTVVVPSRADRVHEVLFHLDALKAVGIPIRSTKLSVDIDDISAFFASTFWERNRLEDKRVVGINASGGWYTKRWPLKAFAQLGDRLATDFGLRILLFWGPGERQDVQEIANLMQQPAVLAPQSDLNQLSALLARLDLLISNDSGPMHLAAAVGTPVLGIYGPTRPELQGPWGNGHQVVRKDDLPCIGCNGTTCKITTHACMQELSVDAVYDKAARMLENLTRPAPQPASNMSK